MEPLARLHRPAQLLVRGEGTTDARHIRRQQPAPPPCWLCVQGGVVAVGPHGCGLRGECRGVPSQRPAAAPAPAPWGRMHTPCGAHFVACTARERLRVGRYTNKVGRYAGCTCLAAAATVPAYEHQGSRTAAATPGGAAGCRPGSARAARRSLLGSPRGGAPSASAAGASARTERRVRTGASACTVRGARGCHGASWPWPPRNVRVVAPAPPPNLQFPLFCCRPAQCPPSPLLALCACGCAQQPAARAAAGAAVSCMMYA